MHVAIQTIAWGAHPRSIKEMLREIKEARYQGVEFAQHPDEIGPVEKLLELLADVRLRFVGIAGGALHERILFVNKFSELSVKARPRTGKRGRSRKSAQSAMFRSPYVYLDDWEGLDPKSGLQMGPKLAVHPHMFKQIQTASEAERLLEDNNALRFLPDTAHLMVAGDDVVDVIDRNFRRIEAIHLKDWSAEYGRAYQFYSRGFVELGTGDVPVSDVVRYLKRKSFSGWIVVEQDMTEDPFRSANASREWLAKRGI